MSQAIFNPFDKVEDMIEARALAARAITREMGCYLWTHTRTIILTPQAREKPLIMAAAQFLHDHCFYRTPDDAEAYD